jgi:hypothetical protein
MHRPRRFIALPGRNGVSALKRIPTVGEMTHARGFRFHEPGKVLRVRVLRGTADVEFANGQVRQVLFSDLEPVAEDEAAPEPKKARGAK